MSEETEVSEEGYQRYVATEAHLDEVTAQLLAEMDTLYRLRARELLSMNWLILNELDFIDRDKLKNHIRDLHGDADNPAVFAQ